MAKQRLQSVRGIAERNALVEQWQALPAWVLQREPFVRPTDYHDMLSEGFLGLIRAAELWRPDGGSKFVTYAVQWIRQHYQRWREKQGLPSTRKGFRRYDRPRMKVVSPETMAETTGCDESFIAELDADLDVRMLVGSIRYPWRGVLRQWLAGSTLAEIGRKRGQTRERIRQLKEEGLEKLRRKLKMQV